MKLCLCVAVAPPQGFCQDVFCSAHEFCGEDISGLPRCLCRAGFASKYRSTGALGETVTPCLYEPGPQYLLLILTYLLYWATSFIVHASVQVTQRSAARTRLQFLWLLVSWRKKASTTQPYISMSRTVEVRWMKRPTWWPSASTTANPVGQWSWWVDHLTVSEGVAVFRSSYMMH